MKMPPRVVRRVVVDPLWVPVAVGLSVSLLVLAFVFAILAPFTRKRRALRASLLACVYLYIDLGLMFGGVWLWIRHPSCRRDERAWRSQHAALLGRALTRLMSAAHTLFGYEVQFVGTEPAIQHDRPLLVLARHAGPGDSFTLVNLLVTRFGLNPRVVLKQALQWDPGLDVVLTRLGCHFLPSKSGAGEDRTEAVADLSSRLQPGDALLLFPEGATGRHVDIVARSCDYSKRATERKQTASVPAPICFHHGREEPSPP